VQNLSCVSKAAWVKRMWGMTLFAVEFN